MKNITSLRNHLFDTLNRLADATEQDIELETTKAVNIVNVAEAIIKTAEVENQFILITQGTGSGFIPLVDNPPSKQIGNSENILVKEESDYKPKMFDVDSEKNWVIDEGKVIQNNEPSGTHSINTNTD